MLGGLWGCGGGRVNFTEVLNNFLKILLDVFSIVFEYNTDDTIWNTKSDQFIYPNRSVKYDAITSVLIKMQRCMIMLQLLNAAARYQSILCYSMEKQFVCLLADRTRWNYQEIVDSENFSKNQKYTMNLQVEMLALLLLLLMGKLQLLPASKGFQFELLRKYLILFVVIIEIQFFLLQLDLRSCLMLLSAYWCMTDG